MGTLPLFPEQASTLARSVDGVMFFILAVSIFFAVLIAVLILFLSVRYHHRRRVNRLSPPTFHLGLEMTWTGIPLLLALTMFFLGARLYLKMRTPPANAMQVYVVGKQWMWKIQHSEGQREINTLHVPTGRPVTLLMTSEDVIHDFFIPAFRVKQDVLPARYTTLWFEANRPGTYHFFCSQYCGTSHAGMIGQVIALTPADYEKWLNPAGSILAAATGGPVVQPKAGANGAGVNPAMAAAGGKLFEEFKCGSCHHSDGTGQGPPLTHLFGSKVPLEGGETVVANEGYIRESILLPSAKIVRGYKLLMPTYQGQLEEEELMQLITYIKSLK